MLSSQEKRDTLGAGAVRQGIFADFSWADKWQLSFAHQAEAVTFDENDEISGSRTFLLEWPTLALTRNEEGGGLLAWNKENGWYWIHQAD